MLQRYSKSGALMVLLASMLSSCSFFESSDNPKSLRQQLELPGIEYDVDFKVIGETKFESLIIESTQLHLGKKRLPTSSNALRFRVREDMKRIKRILRNKGFFDSKIKAHIAVHDKVKQVTMTVDTGPRYKIAGQTILIPDDDKSINFNIEKQLKVLASRPGEYLDQDKIFEAMTHLQLFFKNHGFPFVVVDEPTGIFDRASQTVNIEYVIHLNGKRRFGQAIISGNKTIEESYIRNRIDWKSGDIYDERSVEKTRRRLINTELFASVVITPEDQGPHAPVKIELTEAPPRLIGTGIKYDTSERFGGKVYWQHHNLFGKGERIAVKLEATQIDCHGSIGVEVPDTLFVDNTLVLRTEGSYEDTKAYKGRVVTLYGGFKHRLFDELIYGYGLELEDSSLKETNKTHKRYLSVPLNALLNYTNDPINPIKGWKIQGEITPHFGELGKTKRMLRMEFYGSYYLRVIKRDTFIIATWARYGQIQQIKNADIPLNKRFYSGGANSIRGYGYQKVGPLNQKNDPIGGQSMVEFGVEPRFKVTDKIGLSAFVEAGTVAVQKTPHFGNKNLFVGYGIGAKYYTEVGPIRLDLAFPSKRRKRDGKHIDSPFQIYISVGQAF